MFDLPAMTWTLTAVLLLRGGYNLVQAARSRQLTDRVNKGLHAFMDGVMAAMLWNLVPSTMLAQILALAGAALWFLIQAVARPEFTTLCASGQSRVKCLYHSLAMFGAALMVAMMGHVTAAPRGIAAAGGMPMSHGQHAMGTGDASRSASPLDLSPVLAILLTVFFAASAVVFIVLVLRSRLTTATLRTAGTARLSVRAEQVLESAGAAVMALMFATMWA